MLIKNKKYLILFLVFLFVACGGETEKQNFTPYQLSLPNVENEIYKFEKNENFIIVYWATWCPACTQTMPVLNKFSRENNIKIVGISLDEGSDTAQEIKKYAQKYKIDFPLLIAKNHMPEAVKQYKIKYLPTILFFNKNGKEIKRVTGYKSEKELKKLYKTVY